MVLFSRLAAASLKETSLTLSEKVENAFSRVLISGWGVGERSVGLGVFAETLVGAIVSCAVSSSFTMKFVIVWRSDLAAKTSSELLRSSAMILLFPRTALPTSDTARLTTDPSRPWNDDLPTSGELAPPM